MQFSLKLIIDRKWNMWQGTMYKVRWLELRIDVVICDVKNRRLAVHDHIKVYYLLGKGPCCTACY
jgi:hypothetical protein